MVPPSVACVMRFSTSNDALSANMARDKNEREFSVALNDYLTCWNIQSISPGGQDGMSCEGSRFGAFFAQKGVRNMQKTPGKTPQEREHYWTKIIEEARKYPAGVRAYCEDKNISHNNYYSWFKVLRTKHPEWTDLSNVPTQPRKNQEEAAVNEVEEKAQRRTFSAAYKAKILKEAEASTKGQIAALLRREGLYYSHLQKWRKERDTAGLEAKKRGPKLDPSAAELKKLQKENAKLLKKLEQANRIIDFQKKISEILGVTLESQPDQEDE